MTAQLCGAYADHADHIDPRLGRRDSALQPGGSTRRWRRIRAYVLDRDGRRCQVLLDPSGQVVEAERPATPPAGPDDPAWLRATCPHHNLTRGSNAGDAAPRTTESRPAAGRWDW